MHKARRIVRTSPQVYQVTQSFTTRGQMSPGWRLSSLVCARSGHLSRDISGSQTFPDWVALPDGYPIDMSSTNPVPSAPLVVFQWATRIAAGVPDLDRMGANVGPSPMSSPHRVLHTLDTLICGSWVCYQYDVPEYIASMRLGKLSSSLFLEHRHMRLMPIKCRPPRSLNRV